MRSTRAGAGQREKEKHVSGNDKEPEQLAGKKEHLPPKV
jgi:hypothetical protein